MNIGECFGEWQSVIGIPSRLTVHGSPPTSHETLESPDGEYLLSGFRPRTTGSFLCMPKEWNRKKRHPGLCAPKTGVPSLGAWLRRFAQGTGPCAWGERGGPCPATSCLPFALTPRFGLSKGVPKQNNARITTRGSRFTDYGSERNGAEVARLMPAAVAIP